MDRIPIVKDVTALDPAALGDIPTEAVIGDFRVSDEAAAKLYGLARAGNKIVMNGIGEERQDGFHLLAVSFAPDPVKVDQDGILPGGKLEVSPAPPQGDKSEIRTSANKGETDETNPKPIFINHQFAKFVLRIEVE